MRLYLLDHRHRIDDEYYDTKLIGIFSSHANAERVKKQYSVLPGFCDSENGFHMEHFDVSSTDAAIKNGTVYLLTTTKVLDSGDELTVSYRICTHILPARFTQLKNALSFSQKDKSKVYVSKYPIDRASWCEGYVSVNSEDEND